MSALLTPSSDGGEVMIAGEEQARSMVEDIKRRAARLWERAAEIAVDQEDLADVVGMAYRHRVWIPLGYDSWEELAEAEFKGAYVAKEIDRRRERVQALVAEGLTSRAVGVVLGISHQTVQRDALATGPNGPVAKPAAVGPSAPASATVVDGAVSSATLPAPSRMQGLDGKERPRKRATPAEMADRLLIVAQRRAEGWTQQQIGDALGITQRTISNDAKVVEAWKEELSATEVKRLEAGQMSRAELAESANLEIVEQDRKRLEAGARNGASALTDGLKYLSESVVYADAWLEERAETSAILAPSLANVAGEGAEWMALEFDYRDVADEELQLLHDDLGRAAEWAQQAQRRLVSAAEERGLELDRDGYRDALERKVQSRRGSQR